MGDVMEYVKVCEICGKEFVKTGNCQKYCSKECSEKAKKDNYNKKYREERQILYQLRCSVCGGVFISGRWYRVYCSKECSDISFRGKRREVQRVRWAKNREKLLEYSRRHRKTLKGRINNIVCAHQRRFCGHVIDRDYIKELLLQEKCYYCGKELRIETVCLDHKTPLFRGGTNDNENIVACCAFCNFQKGKRTEEEYRLWLEEMRQAGVDTSRSVARQPAYRRFIRAKKR